MATNENMQVQVARQPLLTAAAEGKVSPEAEATLGAGPLARAARRKLILCCGWSSEDRGEAKPQRRRRHRAKRLATTRAHARLQRPIEARQWQSHFEAAARQ